MAPYASTTSFSRPHPASFTSPPALNSSRYHSPHTAPIPSHWHEPALKISAQKLPHLPPIHDDLIRERAFTHITFVRLQKRTASTYEHEVGPLEFLGDGVLRHMLGEALYHRFPGVSSNALSNFREKLGQNHTLSFLSWYYGLGTQIRVAPALLGTPNELVINSQEVAADILEAYIGALRHEGGSLDRGSAFGVWIERLVTTDVFPTLDADVEALVASEKSLSEAPLARGPGIVPGETKKRPQLEWDPNAPCTFPHPPPVPVEKGFQLLEVPVENSVWHTSRFTNGTFTGCGLGRTKLIAKNQAMANISAGSTFLL